MIYVGIDPGKDGAIAALDADRQVFMLKVVPTVKPKRGPRQYIARDMRALFADILALSIGGDNGNVACCIEKARTYKHDGKVSAFSNGEGYGLWRGFLSAFNIPYQEIQAQAWQKVILAGYPKGDPKATAQIVAGQLWPHQSWLKTDRCSTVHQGLIDAILIAEYCRRLSV